MSEEGRREYHARPDISTCHYCERVVIGCIENHLPKCEKFPKLNNSFKNYRSTPSEGRKSYTQEEKDKIHKFNHWTCGYCGLEGKTHVDIFSEHIKQCKEVNIKVNLQDLEKANTDHPFYYNKGKIEVIDFIEDQELGFHLGNVVKYLCRDGKAKNRVKRLEDLEKAKWYLDRYIKEEVYLDQHKY